MYTYMPSYCKLTEQCLIAICSQWLKWIRQYLTDFPLLMYHLIDSLHHTKAFTWDPFYKCKSHWLNLLFPGDLELINQIHIYITFHCLCFSYFFILLFLFTVFENFKLPFTSLRANSDQHNADINSTKITGV